MLLQESRRPALSKRLFMPAILMEAKVAALLVGSQWKRQAALSYFWCYAAFYILVRRWYVFLLFQLCLISLRQIQPRRTINLLGGAKSNSIYSKNMIGRFSFRVELSCLGKGFRCFREVCLNTLCRRWVAWINDAFSVLCWSYQRRYAKFFHEVNYSFRHIAELIPKTLFALKFEAPNPSVSWLTDPIDVRNGGATITRFN